MTREQAKELLPIIKAFAEGKLIQGKDALNDWCDINEIYLGDEQLRKLKMEYRIKPEPKYRPFKNGKECWQEMHNHPDFGWVQKEDSKAYISIGMVGGDPADCGVDGIDYSEFFNEYTFTDNEPFGIKEE